MQHSRQRYDVVVVGGGAAGAAAAVSAARSGARVLLIERYGFLGGAATNAQVLAYCGLYLSGAHPVRSVAGVGQDLLEEIDRLGIDTTPVRSQSGHWIVMLDIEATKLAFDRLVMSSGAELCLHTFLVGAHVTKNRIEAITIADHCGIREVEATCFVDASGEAGLSVHAGVALSQPGGTHAHLQPASFPVRIGGIPPEVEPDRARLAEIIGEHNAHSNWPLTRADGGVLMRLPVSRDFWSMAIDVKTDGVSGADLTRAETFAREQARQCLTVLRRLPGFENAHLLATGPQIGIRESRRPLSHGDMTGDDGLQGRRRADGVGRASWPMEVHEAPGRARFVQLGGEGFFDISPSALRAQSIDNLYLAGRVVGADAQAYGSIRVMGTAFATGHAAGAMATLEADSCKACASTLRRTLLAQNAIV